MVVGTQTLVSFTVVNNGGSPTGDLQVSLPSTPYLTLASPATIPSLAPGASSQVTLELSPAADLPLEQYTGTIAINSSLIGLGMPFTFTAISSATGMSTSWWTTITRSRRPARPTSRARR